VDIQFVAAMGQPGGGRNPVTPRFVRHFNLLSVTESDYATYASIFSAITSWCASALAALRDPLALWCRKAHLAVPASRGKGRGPGVQSAPNTVT
jgi:hypothetical protein